MTSVTPPTYYFDGITFNSAFYTTSSSGGLTQAQANALYLKKNTADTATALETLSGGILTNDIQSTTTSEELTIGNSQTDGALRLGNGGSTRTGNIIIGSLTMTGEINIETRNANNNVGTNLSAISIGTAAVAKVIRIGSSTTAGTVTLGDLQFITNNNQSTNFINNITNTTRAISIGNNQTTGALGLGTGGTGPIARQSGADINIATQASNACAVNVMNGLTTAGSVNIANGTGATQSTTVSIGSGSTTGTVTIGNPSNTYNSNSGIINIKAGVGTLISPLAGTVNIGTGSGSGYVTTAVNIATGNTNVPVKIGNVQNTIELIAPVKSFRNLVLSLGGATNTITEAQILTYNFFSSQYTLANPSASNDSVGVTLPAPTSAMVGMTLVFRKIRGAISNSGTNWAFSCSSSSFVVNSLTFTATPTVSSLSVSTLVARFTVLEYSGALYYFVM